MIKQALAGLGVVDRNTLGTRSVIDRGSFSPVYPFFVGPNGIEYPIFGQTLIGNQESMAPTYLSFLQQAYQQSPIIFSCIVNRMALFSEARFQFRQRRSGRPGDLFGSPELQPLEQPWPGGTTSNLLTIAELHVSCAGNFFAARRGDQLRVMRPDWTAIVLGSPNEGDDVGPLDLDAEVIGYLYQEGGPGSGKDPLPLLPHEVAHFMPIPDGECPYRGMSWITPVIRELLADKELTTHKRKFLEAGATPNLAVKLNVDKMSEFEAWVQKFTEAREGQEGNPYKTLFVAAVADPIPIGTNLEQIDFAKVQGAGEVRIAAAAMTHPSIAGFMEGLQGSALNAGNFAEVFRQYANHTMRPLWRDFAGAMSPIINVPSSAELWYDDRDIPALKEDIRKAGERQQADAASISTLISAGFDPDSVVEAVTSGDFTRLTHTGLTSVQLQKPGEQSPPPPPSTNGSGQKELVPAP